MYATTKQLKTIVFRINSQYTKQAIGIQVIFITEQNLQKEHFLAKKTLSFRHFCAHFEPLLGRECTYVCRH